MVERTPPRRRPRLELLALAAAGLLVLLPGNGHLPLIDRDEPRFAQATREMMQRGEWVVPYFNDDYRFDKPVLIYWMMRVSYAALGVNEFAARLPSVLTSVLLAWALFGIGARWFSRRAGFLAGFGFLTCLQMFMHGRSAVADMPMILAVVLSQFAAFELLHGRNGAYPWRWFWLLWGAQGVGFLAKGPVTQAIPLLTLLAHRFLLWRKPMPWKRLKAGRGLAVLLVIIGAWGLPALVRTQGEFLTLGIYTHVFKRGWSTFNGHASFFSYYLVLALFSLFPWIAFAGRAAADARANWDEKYAFLLSWMLSTYLLFSFYMSKLPHYVLPAFPAFFLVIGRAVDAPRGRWSTAWFWGVTGLWLVLGGVAVAAAAAAPGAGPYAPMRRVLAGAALLVFALAALGVLWHRRAPHLSVVPLAAAAVSVTLIGAGLRAMTPAVQLLPFFRGMPDDTVCGFCFFKEPSLVFYANRRWEILDDVDDVDFFLRKPAPRVAVVTERETRPGSLFGLVKDRLETGSWHPRMADYAAPLGTLRTNDCEVFTVEGVNIARTAAVRLRVLYKP